MQVALLTAEASEARVDPRPGRLPAGEDAQSLHADLEGLALGVLDPLVGSPLAIHPGAPSRFEMGPDHGLEGLVEQWTLHDIERLGVGIEVLEQPAERARSQQDVRIDTEDDVGVGLPKDEVAGGGAAITTERQVANLWNIVRQLAQCGSHHALGVVVEYEEREVREHVGLGETHRLNGEAGPIEVVIGRHPDAQPPMRSGRAGIRANPSGLLLQLELPHELFEMPLGAPHSLMMPHA